MSAPAGPSDGALRALPGGAGLFDHLKTVCAGDWRAYTDHAFVRALSDGTLPEAAFRTYLIQDYLFLIHFARAYALAAYKGETLSDIRHASESLKVIVETEMGLHIDFCRGWGLEEADMTAAEEAPETLAYTRYVLECGVSGDLLDLHVALAPCMCGYAEIGRTLATRPGAVDRANPYAAWIEMYASDAFQEAARAEEAMLDELYVRRAGEGRLPRLERIFRDAARLEAAFWQMGLSAAG